MKRSMILTGVVLTATLLLAANALAANKGSVQIQEQVFANGQAIPAGEYKVTWEGNGPDVKLNILKFNKAIATVPARVVELQFADSVDSTVTRKNDDGSVSLLEIHLRGRKYAFVLEAGESGVGSGRGTSNRYEAPSEGRQRVLLRSDAALNIGKGF